MRKNPRRSPRSKSTLPQVGGSPGALLYLGRHKLDKSAIRVTCFSQQEMVEREVASIQDCLDLLDDPSRVTWIDVAGLQNLKVIEEIGTHFSIHQLVLEDILNSKQRPKIETHKTYLFLVMRTLILSEQSEDDQVSVIIGPRFVLSFQERKEDLFGPVRTRLREGRPRIRGNGADYLAYALIDTVVDGYFVMLENLSDEIDRMGDELLVDPEAADLHDIFRLKRTLGSMRHSVWPMREIINQLTRGEFDLITDFTTVYLRDVYDHTIRAIETVEALRDLTSGLHDLYLSIVSHRMNEVMKVLTIIATIFIPLTFIAGVYGMNFTVMPELQWKWGYPLVWLIMLITGIIMLIFFKRKKWL